MFRRVRSTCRSTYYMHTEGTKIKNIRHKNLDFISILAISHNSQKPSKSAIFQTFFFRENVQKKSSRMSRIAFSNSSWLFFSAPVKSGPNLKSDELSPDDVFKHLDQFEKTKKQKNTIRYCHATRV